MTQMQRDNRSYRGVLQSGDGHIVKVLEQTTDRITFQARYGLSSHMVEQLKNQPEHIVFSERSRIARLGIQITAEAPTIKQLKGDQLVITQTATAMIPGYPGLKELGPFFDSGLPVGRLVFCDPKAQLSSEEVMRALEGAQIKLPASTAISSDGSIVIAPHKVVCDLHSEIDKPTFGRILLREDGRDMLNRYQVNRSVDNVVIPPGEGVITTCSMYLHDHYVVLQSGFSLGRNLPATVLDPIKTRGIRIYLEIVNSTANTIVNPLITARVYGAPKYNVPERRKTESGHLRQFGFKGFQPLKRQFDASPPKTCHFISRPIAVIKPGCKDLKKVPMAVNGPRGRCRVSKAECATDRRDFSVRSQCAHIYASAKLQRFIKKRPVVLALKYFPNLMEHRDIINLAAEGKIDAIHFFDASCEHGPFLSQQDHSRLQEYQAYGVSVYWVCGLNRRLMVHTMRDGKGYFVALERMADFHKSMLFAFYGSTLPLSETGEARLGSLMDALVGFWGRNIGIVTGGGSGVMEVANTLARQRGILSGANFLEITDQPMTTDVDFCQVFQATCRHSRQKWFEIASFPIFNVGGLGTLEELGITLCNMKLSIMERVPIILFDTEGNSGFWDSMYRQVVAMVDQKRAPEWILDHLLITDNPQEVIEAYHRRLQLF